MSAAKSVTANFALIQYAMTVSKTGTGTGTVNSSPAGINCGADCSENYNSGIAVTLTASAVAGSSFTGWSGACTGTGACSVTMSAAQSVTANFTLLSLPDLVTTQAEAKKVVFLGTTYDFRHEVRNNGTAASGAFRVGFYHSTDTTFNPQSDTFICASAQINGLAVGAVDQNMTLAFTHSCRSSAFNQLLASGHVFAVVDYLGQVNELNEGNNALQAVRK
jgi:hypothetical protein